MICCGRNFDYVFECVMSNPEFGTGKLVLLAAATAAASSFITYSIFKYGSTLNRLVFQPSEAPIPVLVHPTALTPPTGLLRKADPYDTSPRKGYLSWDDYFMAVAFLSSQRSKDPNKQVGACIVDTNNVICGIGYNGFPRGCPDHELPWAKSSSTNDPLATKYPYVCHAEMNAILNKNGASIVGSRMYVTMFPCNECAKLMIQAGIKEVVFHEDKQSIVNRRRRRPESPPNKDGFKQAEQYAASRRLLALAGVKARQHKFERPVILELTNYQQAPAVVSATTLLKEKSQEVKDLTSFLNAVYVDEPKGI